MFSPLVKKIVFIIVCLFLASSAWAETTPPVRILIKENVDALEIYAKSARLCDEKNACTELANQKMVIGFAPSIMTLSSADRIWIDGRAFHGSFNIYPKKVKKIDVVNIVPIETYLKGILAGEMPSKWPIEALKAQAVTARTYAIKTANEKRRGSYTYDLKATIEDQVYTGVTKSTKIGSAVDETFGEVITHAGKPIKARFHSTCGGQTETAHNVWNEKDMIESVSDPYCKASPHRSWKLLLTSKDIEKKLQKKGFNPGRITTINIEKSATTGRVGGVSIHGQNQTLALNGNDFRKYIGFGRIKSTLFDVTKSGNSFLFTGSGFGHGVGMCQWGAKGMGEAGKSYKEIVNFYYPGTKIVKYY